MNEYNLCVTQQVVDSQHKVKLHIARFELSFFTLKHAHHVERGFDILYKTCNILHWHDAEQCDDVQLDPLLVEEVRPLSGQIEITVTQQSYKL